MNPLRWLHQSVRALLARRKLDAEMDEEMRSHIEMQTQEHIEAGLPPVEARRAAFREFGHVDGIKETCREQREGWLGRQLSMTGKDLLFALRQLRKSPGFTVVAVLTLALGIGASTAVYSVLNNVILNPVPGPEPERLLQIAERWWDSRTNSESENFFGVTPPVWEALRRNEDFFAELAWYETDSLERKTDDFVDRVTCAFVSPNFFSLWATPPVLGRTFAEDEAVPQDENGRIARDSVIVITHAWWRSFFQGDPDVVGKRVELSGRQFTVIGVMPEYFGFPGWGTAFWVPVDDPELPPNVTTGANYKVLARMKPETTERQTQAMLDTVARRVSEEHADGSGYSNQWDRHPDGLALQTRPVRYAIQGEAGGEDLRRTLFGLLAAIGFVLFIVCANIATLTLARGERRQQEFAARIALGADRMRLMRQVLTESVLLACLGGLGGLLVTFWGVKLFMSLVPETLPRLRAVEVDGTVLSVTLLISMATGILFGLVPAWRASKTPLGEAVKQVGSMAPAGVWRSRYRDILVVIQISLALVLLTGAGLMIQSVIRMLNVDPGYDPENLLRVSVGLPFSEYASQQDRINQLLGDVHERFASLPGVLAVGIHKDPGSGFMEIEVDGPRGPTRVAVRGSGVEESDLFAAMRVSLLAGRPLNREDIADGYFSNYRSVEGISAVVINESLANTLWPGQDPIGRRFSSINSESKRQYEVVGLVGDVREYRYDQETGPIAYRPYHEFYITGAAPEFLIRTSADPDTLVPAIRRELIAAEPAMRTPSINLVSRSLYDSTQAERTYMTYLVVFAGVGLALSAIGIYGVLTYSVARRTREIGIRMAVGADRLGVVGLIIKDGVRLIAAGIVLGLLAAAWLTRFVEHRLFEVDRMDPLVYAGVALVLASVALLACLFPALRATRIEPTKALRYE